MTKVKSKDKDKGQSSLFDFGDLTQEEKLEITQISHKNDILDSEKLREDNNDNLPIDDSSILRSEQIIISKDNYPTMINIISQQKNRSIGVISKCCHRSKNLCNECLFLIRQAFFGKIKDIDCQNEKELILRKDIYKELNKYKNLKFEELKTKNYKNSIYKLLNKFFQSKKDDNYIWSPQSSQQIIDMTVEAWLDNDLARRDYKGNPDHRKNYTGEPKLPNYRKSLEWISVFTNQQCKIDTVIYNQTSNYLYFPDHLNIKPIKTRLTDKDDIREIRIIPLVMKGYYKIELVYKKVIEKIKIGKDKFIKLSDIKLDLNRIIGIDTGQENIVTIGNNIGISPIIIKGGVILAENQWFDKIGSKLYEIYYRQQYHEQGKKDKVEMGSKMKSLSFKRKYKILDILHKISRYIVNYCIRNRIGTIVWGRNEMWKQRINLGKKTNQKFTKIPHYLLFNLMKYKAQEVGIKVIDNDESHTSKCSFLDNESICHQAKYLGKRTKRGLFRSAKGIIINADVNAAYNMIRKVFPEAFKSIGIVGVVLHPERLSIKDLL